MSDQTAFDAVVARANRAAALRRLYSRTALVLIVLGTLVLAASAWGIFGTIWAGTAIIGLVLIVIGVLIGMNG